MTDEARPLDVGLLLCGHIHADLVADNGDYPEVFADLLGPLGVTITPYEASAGELPGSVDERDGWLISGSADSVYDDLPWIAPLESFVRDIVAAHVPLVAVCFGHQLLAQALGGRVARSDAGWGVGAHDYRLAEHTPQWLTRPADGTFRLIASHQDQVVEVPDGAEVIAYTEHCPVAAYTVGPAALAIQPHPEFTAAVSKGLIERRRDSIGPDRADAQLATLSRPLDRDLVGRWMVDFLRAAAAVAPTGRA